MKRIWIYIALAAAAGILALAAPDGRGAEAADEGAEDVAGIRALYAAWNDAVENGDVPGYLAVLDEDVELMPTDAPPIQGRDNYGVFLGPVFTSDRFEIEVAEPAAIEIDGDLAWARYDYIIHRLPAGSDTRISSYRKFLDVLKRQPDGSFRVLKHIWNYNEPGVTP